MFGRVNVWRIAELKVIGEIKFWRMDRFGHKVPLPAKIWLVKVWRITHDLPNSPNFPAAKHSCYTVHKLCIVSHKFFHSGTKSEMDRLEDQFVAGSWAPPFLAPSRKKGNYKQTTAATKKTH